MSRRGGAAGCRGRRVTRRATRVSSDLAPAASGAGIRAQEHLGAAVAAQHHRIDAHGRRLPRGATRGIDPPPPIVVGARRAAFCQGILAHRAPYPMPRNDGALPLRYEASKSEAPLAKLPPRNTWYEEAAALA